MGQKPLEIGTFEAQFAKLITAKNRACGGTVRSLADISGVSRSRLDRILRGETSITATDIERISSALAERLAERRLTAEAATRPTEALPAPVALPSPRGPVFAEDESLPEGWETRLAARRVEDTPEAREDAFLDSLGEESQE